MEKNRRILLNIAKKKEKKNSSLKHEVDATPGEQSVGIGGRCDGADRKGICKVKKKDKVVGGLVA